MADVDAESAVPVPVPPTEIVISPLLISVPPTETMPSSTPLLVTELAPMLNIVPALPVAASTVLMVRC